jgi:hypothetical protein
MAHHHYVPQFLLGEWLDRGQLTSYRWLKEARRVVRGRVAASKACGIENLNTFFNSDDAPETDFFTPVVDTPAAKAHRKLIERGVSALTPSDRLAWARFIVAFPVRTPETLRTLGPTQFRLAMEQAFSQPTDDARVEAVARAIVDREMPQLEHDAPLRVAVELASDPHKHFVVESMFWWTRSFKRGDIILGDRPLLSHPPSNWPCGIALNVPNVLIALPLSHDKVFFASPQREIRTRMARQHPGRIARLVNITTPQRAAEFVYAVGVSQRALIETEIEKRNKP